MSARLGVRLADGPRPVGVGLADLVGLAVRRNPRRAHLLVSAVLGKHVPTDPRLVYGSGLLLGELVRARLRGEEPPRPGAHVADALWGVPGAAAGLRDLMRAPQIPVDAVVLGYAETATALGHSVADALGGAYYLHSTRRPVPGFATYGGFEEEHSHATSHLLLPADPAALDRDVPAVLVDDELSTGRTVLNTIEALHAVRPRGHYVLAALVDLRGTDDRARMDELAERLGTRIEAVSLAQGHVGLPDGILESGKALVADLTARAALPEGAAETFPVSRLDLEWPSGLPDGGRHGFLPVHRSRLEKDLGRMAEALAAALGDDASRVLVLGFEELMYTPLRLAEALADTLPSVDVRYSTTTRSPVLAVDDPGYAIRTRLAFDAHDDPADGPGERYAYNVAPASGHDGFDRIVFVVDDAGDTPALAGGLVARLRALAPVLVAPVPAWRGR
ncbi:phosphoribosyltransferase family protein [Actinomadura livida]|uniref:Adenine/guanine phosphoribosyltransferase-like PRPP-binding protein n=1 Tax=Actinomadura livida TaxID=79909 RepID=A0A7W7IGE2_9ACTN|nr:MULTISPECIES: phosphoribosyltransferase family protein [Actinomadura]MBB4776622.1 adenine/guanine phosphoribosyltransferase-like PRPP-binding protein [Actinomadura catellatispora]